MFKGHYKKLKTAAVATLTALCISCSVFGAACNDNTTDGDDKNNNVKREDKQVLQNGDFEYFDLPTSGKYEYLIRTPDNWNSEGSASHTKSGVISTSESAWNKLTAADLAERLDDNANILPTDSDYEERYVDYNGMASKDILYKNSYAALFPDDEYGIEERDGGYYYKDGDSEVSVYKKSDGEYYAASDYSGTALGKDLIDNPGTHYDLSKEGDKLYTTVDGEKKEVLTDDNDNLYYANGDEEVYISNVLMVHNFATNHYGLTSGYSSQDDVELKANTSAVISFWVKTAFLSFDEGKSVNDDEDKGAYIHVKQFIGSTEIDDFSIRAINTEKIIELNKDNPDFKQSNGWIQYKIYVNGCDFSDSSVAISLGLGDEGNENFVEGYAFFDDVEIKRYSSSVSQIEGFDSEAVKNTSCTLINDEEEKTFNADTLTVNGVEIDNDKKIALRRTPTDFTYLIDLASQGSGEHNYQKFDFGSNTEFGLTVDDTDKNAITPKYYAAAKTADGKKVGNAKDATMPSQTELPSGLRGVGVRTDNDLFGIYAAAENFDSVKSTDFPTAGYDYSSMLNEELASVYNLPNTEKGNIMLMVSAYGAPYTATVKDTAFTISADSYKIISFWVKTSSVKGTAATISVYERDENGERDNLQSLTVDTTDVTTDIDDNNKDIFNGWVQCFFFVHNDAKEEKTFEFSFSFGLTSLAGAERANLAPGWAAIANLQILSFEDEKIFSYVSTGDYAAKLEFTDDEDDGTGKFDEAVSKIGDGFIRPQNYTGYNGGSSNVIPSDLTPRYDDENTSPSAGLINKEKFVALGSEPEWFNAISNAFSDAISGLSTAEEKWEAIFGASSVQPLVIVNNLRTIVERAAITEDDFNLDPTLYYTYDSESGEYQQCKAGDKFDSDTKYFTNKQLAINYGYRARNAESVSSNSYAVLSVRVKVSEGALAYVYLTDGGHEVLGYETPELTFWYDEEGNVLKGKPADDETEKQHRDNIAYSLRDDGLYEDADGKLYANLNNMVTFYTDESKEYFDEDGNPVVYERLQEGTDYYYSDGKLANHYLKNTKSSTALYEYNDGKYYYMVNGKRGSEISNFDTAVAAPRYTVDEETLDSMKYCAKIVGDESNAGKWIQVNFYIAAGSDAKDFYLEVWSGAREVSGVTASGEVDGATASKNGSVVIFEHSFASIDQSGFTNALSGKQSEIIGEYSRLLSKYVTKDEVTIGDYEKLAEEKVADPESGITREAVDAIKNKYDAFYYSYSFYDADNFAPFNAETAEDGATGYNYTPTDDEKLAYFKFEESTNDGKSINVFADYSAVNQSVELNDGISDEETTEDEGGGVSADLALLITSIVLVAALIIALVSLLLRQLLKKRAFAGKGRKNDNGEGRRRRYLRRLRIEKSEYEEIDLNPDDK